MFNYPIVIVYKHLYAMSKVIMKTLTPCSLGRKRTTQLGALAGLPVSLGIAFMPWFSLVLALRMVMGAVGRIVLIPSVSLSIMKRLVL